MIVRFVIWCDYLHMANQCWSATQMLIPTTTKQIMCECLRSYGRNKKQVFDHVIGEKKLGRPGRGSMGTWFMIRGAIMRICFLSKSSVQNVEKRNMNNMIARFISSNTESLEKHERARFTQPGKSLDGETSDTTHLGWRSTQFSQFNSDKIEGLIHPFRHSSKSFF